MLTTGKPRQPAELMEKLPWGCQVWNKAVALIWRFTWSICYFCQNL